MPRRVPRNSEGAGNAGRQVHPQPRVENKNTRVRHHRFTGTIRHSLRDGVTAYTCSPRRPPETGLCCLRRRPAIAGQLDPSVGGTGPHDFAVRVSAARQASPSRPSHPETYVRGGARSPLWWNQDGRRIRTILISDKAKYFSPKGWTGRNRRRLL